MGFIIILRLSLSLVHPRLLAPSICYERNILSKPGTKLDGMDPVSGISF